jgi:cation:H+ antiporter
LLLLLLAAYMYATYVWARQGSEAAFMGEAMDDSGFVGLGKCWFMLLGGLVLVVAGARVLVPSAAGIASRIGVPYDVIVATMVALGTSLPELMTAITAVRKGHPEIMVDNVVGAGVLNCLFVIRAAAVKPLEISPNFFRFHFLALLLILYSLRAFIFVNKDGWFKTSQGVWLLGIYLIYLLHQYALNIGTVSA